MKITDLKCNRMNNPLGFDFGFPRLSWILSDVPGDLKITTRVMISLSEDFNNLWYDSGNLNEDNYDSACFEVEKPLEPMTRYFWKVVLKLRDGESSFEQESETAFFETSKLDQPWAAKWISPDFGDNSIHPLLRKEFGTEAGKRIVSARAYVCGLGLYEIKINGQKVGDEYFTPFCNAYDKWIQYQTFDVTDLVIQGDNCVGAMLGNGWYKGRFSFAENKTEIYGSKFSFLCEIVVTYDDCTRDVIITDNSWKAFPSFILDGNIYDGEVQDATKHEFGWSSPDYDDSNWKPVIYSDIGFNLLQSRKSVPVRIVEKITPIEIITTPQGDTVIDFGQNMVGWVEFKISNPDIREVCLQFCEALEQGNFYRENYRSAKSEFKFISDGKTHIVRPYFAFYGFRYMKITGWTEQIDLNDFTGCVIHSDLERIGNIETSDPLVNRLFLNALWGQKGNFLDVPTDCPQRDERLGWTGDVLSFSGTGCFNMDCDAFYHKFLYDLYQEQLERNGGVPPFIPFFKSDIVDGKRYEEDMFSPPGACGWSDAATVVPWNNYLHYGDKNILKQQFNSMRDWVNAIRRYDTGNRLWDSGFHFGDWLSLDASDPDSPFGGTPAVFLASCFYYYSATLVYKAARVLGFKKEENEYSKLAGEIKHAIITEFLTPTGRLAIDTQTAYCYMLFLDLVPSEFRTRLALDLVKNIEKNKGHLQTGFLGTQILCRVLSDNGHNDVAYKLLLNKEYPGWLYAVTMGATTIWERWNSILPDGKFNFAGMNSLNHYSYGSVVEWMYRNMCGINPIEAAPGFKRFKLSPQPDPSIGWVKGTLKSPYGLIESKWEYKDGGILYEFTIPYSTFADVVLTGSAGKSIKINDKEISDSGLETREIDGNVLFGLSAGIYRVEVI